MKRWIAGMAATLVAVGSAHAEGVRGNLNLSQMDDDTPAADYALQCGFAQTHAYSVWRRFRFGDHAVEGSATVESVTVATESGGPAPITVNLYRLPHSMADETVPVPALTRIGTATTTTSGAPLTSITVPVTGTIADTLEYDLVAEYHVDDFNGQYRIGGNSSGEIHEAYVSAAACAQPEPVQLSHSGFNYIHPIIVVNLASTGPGLPRLAGAFAVDSVPVGQSARLTLTLHNETRPAATTLTAALVDRLPAGLALAAQPNASTTCASGTLTAAPGSVVVTLATGARIPASGTCTVAFDVRSSSTGRFVNTLGAGSLRTDGGDNVNAFATTLLVLSDAPPSFPPGEDFDINPAPALPNGWTSSTNTGKNDWITVPSTETMPNAAWVRDPVVESDYTLDSPSFVPVVDQNVSFRQRYDLDRVPGYLEYGMDGGALEISIDGGEFVDILDAGGSFAANGYNATIAGINALSQRRAWSGDTGGQFVTTIATLPASAVGHAVRLRFHFADDADNPAFYTPRSTGGWWIDSVRLGLAQVPVASVGPAALSLTVAANASTTTALTVSNGYGKDPLDYAIRAADAGAAATHPVLRLPEPARTALGAAPDAIAWRVDDGKPETAFGFGRADDEPPGERAAVWLNRFHATAALTVDSISIYWPAAAQAGGNLRGLQANLVVYYDADADGDATNAVRVGADRLVSITQTGAFETYPTSFAIPGAGDVYVGFVDHWAIGGYYRPPLFPAALDRTTPQGRSYVSAADIGWPLNLANLGNNLLNGTVESVMRDTLSGNWLIRATSTGNGTPAPCAGLSVNWLTALPASGTVEGGANATVTVRATPAIGQLEPGHYTHDLCVATSDPKKPLVVVPVNLTVTQSPCATADSLFCGGFEAATVQPVRDPSLESIEFVAGPNPYWASQDGFNAPGATVFHSWHSSEVSAHSGNIGASLGGWGRIGLRAAPYQSFFEQTATFPQGGALFLNYWRYTATAADVPSPFVVTIDGRRVDSADFSGHTNGGFVPHSVDVSAWADGGAHTIRFQYDYRGYYFDGLTSIDDITLDRTPLH